MALNYDGLPAHMRDGMQRYEEAMKIEEGKL